MSQPVSHLAIKFFAQCVREKKTGTLQYKAQQCTRQFRMKEGSLVACVSNLSTELPGHIIFKNQLISQAVYDQYLSEHSTLKGDHWQYFSSQHAIADDILKPFAFEHLKKLLYKAFEQSDAVNLQEHQIGSQDTLGGGERLLLDYLQSLSLGTVVDIHPALKEEEAGISLPQSFAKEIPPLPLDAQEKGLIVVVQHNPTLKEVLGASFLGKDRILKLLLAYELLGWVIVKGHKERILDELLNGLTKEQKELRQKLHDLHQTFSQLNFYEWLDLPKHASLQDIQQKSQKLLELTVNPSVEKLYLEDERNILATIFKQAEEVRMVLSHPSKRAQYDAYIDSGGKGRMPDTSNQLKSIDILTNIRKLERDGKRDEAIELYQKSMTQDPQNISLKANFALSLLRFYGPESTKHRDEASKILKALLEKDTQHPEVLIATIAWLKATRQTGKAFEFLKRGFSSHPEVSFFRNELMSSHFADGITFLIHELYRQLSKLNYYEILGISRQAKLEEIKKAYRDCSKKLHPDRFFRTAALEIQSKAKDIYKKIVQGYSVLKDNDKKREYDALLAEESKSS